MNNRPKRNTAAGDLGGIAAFIGNVSGPMMSIYLLNIKMDRDKFYGTRTWFYFIVNIIKATVFRIFTEVLEQTFLTKASICQS